MVEKLCAIANSNAFRFALGPHMFAREKKRFYSNCATQTKKQRLTRTSKQKLIKGWLRNGSDGKDHS